MAKDKRHIIQINGVNIVNGVIINGDYSDIDEFYSNKEWIYSTEDEKSKRDYESQKNPIEIEQFLRDFFNGTSYINRIPLNDGKYLITIETSSGNTISSNDYDYNEIFKIIYKAVYAEIDELAFVNIVFSGFNKITKIEDITISDIKKRNTLYLRLIEDELYDLCSVTNIDKVQEKNKI